MRLGLCVEYDGKSYDILELPQEAFAQLIPGMTGEQMKRLERRFREYWPDLTRCRRHILDFAAEQAGASIDYLLLIRESIHFDDEDIHAYIEERLHSGNQLH